MPEELRLKARRADNLVNFEHQLGEISTPTNSGPEGVGQLKPDI